MIHLLLAVLLASGDPQKLEWTVDGVAREGLVYAPTKESPEGHPLVFGFHGHGGSMQNAARAFKIHELWPEAVVVYLQGLPTPGQLTDPDGKKAGWQKAPGDQGDRDFRFFDAVLAAMKETYTVDPRRIYATGHSNGGGFTYLLWANRPDVFAAIAPSAAAGARPQKDTRPCPTLHLAGEKDPLVRFEIQMRAVAAIKTFNGCDEQGTPWEQGCTRYPSSKDAPVVTFVHPGTHQYPAEGPALIVKFFKETARKP
ncbi:MAG TPA: prolyl oligopeptidase family serine peptidase [Planctomycetota bacterium]|nr:prolyl oligopeptidase family serine peptidase [Planctomycetota bacterium]